MRYRMTLFALALSLLAPAAASAAEHKLEPGDVLEFSVVSLPNLRQRSTIDQDGVISLPFMNGLHTEGFTISQLRAKVQALTSAKPFRQRSADGKETLIMIDADEVTLDVVAYRPVYLTGDVAKPGEQQYRPGMTVRQAIALSGGTDEVRGTLLASQADLPTLRSDASVLRLEIARQAAGLERARAELSNQATLADIKDPDASGSQVARRVVAIEGERLTLNNENFKREQAFLESGAKQASDYLGVLTDQLKNEREGADLDASDFKRLSDLFKTGAVAITRVMDARRAMLLSSTRLLQTGAQRAQTEIRRDDVSRQIEKLAETRKVDSLKEIQGAEVSIGNARLRLRAVEDRIARLEGRHGKTEDATPTISVFRRQGGNTSAVKVDMDSDVLPGDVVEVRMPKLDDMAY
jgi:polysaccharide export outer membrane protein